MRILYQALNIILFLQKRPWVLLGVCLVLLLPALLINLGAMPLIADEPIRALVALELMDSGNLFVSTMRGEFYYNKPPLFNWLLILMFKLTGSQSEFVIRLPTVIFLLSFALSIYLVVKRYVGRKVAFMTALGLITCGRILFYDAFLGLIDILFAWLTYLGYVAVFYYHERKQWQRLFLVTYVITAIGFMLKGLPSFVFQGITLAVFCFYTGNFRKLFSLQHLVGILTMLGIIGAYFYLYSRYNSLDVYFRTLWTESSKRTVAEHTLQESLTHFLAFPFDFLKHFLPWSLLILCCFRKDFWREIAAHPFLKFNLIIFLACFPIYWFSPSTIPRYLFMLVPLFFTPVFHFYFRYQAERPLSNRLVEYAILAGSVLVTLAILAPPFVPLTQRVPWVWAKSLVLFALLGSVTYLSFRLPPYSLYLTVVFLLLVRIGFNWFIFPSRLQTSPEVYFRNSGIKVAQLTKGQPLYLYADTYIDNDVTFYITRERGQILRKDTSATARPDAFYLTEDRHLQNRKYTQFFTFHLELESQTLHLVKFQD